MLSKNGYAQRGNLGRKASPRRLTFRVSLLEQAAIPFYTSCLFAALYHLYHLSVAEQENL